MAKTTVAQLEERLDIMTTRLDNAAKYVKSVEQLVSILEERCAKLEEQDTKTRKQLWYLQKVAKGEFAIGSKSKAA